MHKKLLVIGIHVLMLISPATSAFAQNTLSLDSLAECKGPIGSGGTPKFPNNPPVNCSDEFAWDLFIKLNHPANVNAPGEPNNTKKLGEPGDTIWETWKLRDEIFLDDGCKPLRWEQSAPINVAAPRLSDPASKAIHVLSKILPANQLQPFFDPQRPGAETRLNRAAFDFIVANKLYNIEGQQEFHRQNIQIDFPPASREIKSAWRVITTQELQSGARDRYHTVEHQGKVYGLIALHIITKDLPQWFWSTFEHIENSDIDIRNPVRFERFYDRYTDGGRNLPPAIRGTKWEHFRLKGTQTEFVDLTGEPTILANVIIERGFQGSSSCITCHARAAIGEDGARLSVFEKVVVRRVDPANPDSKLLVSFTGTVGAPDPSLFSGREDAARHFTQTDFMWSLTAAKRQGAECPSR